MSFRIDEKGKVFTARISKQSVAVTARVHDSIIQGMVHLAPDNRLKDELNTHEKFIAITQAQVCSTDGKQVLYTTDVLIVNKEHLAWIFPGDRETSENTSEQN